MSEKFWYLKKCNLFEQLTEEEIAGIERSANLKNFQRKEMVYLPNESGDAILLLVSGRIKIYHITSDGKQSHLAFIDPGEIFGELAVFDSGVREEFAETMEKSTVVLIPGEMIRKLMNEKPFVSMQLSRLMGLRRKKMERRLKALLYRSTRERFIHLLLELAEKYGHRIPEGVLINIRLSHQELSSIIGSTRETVTNALIDLRDEGVIDIQKRKIILKNMDALASSIDELPPSLPETKNDVSTRMTSSTRAIQ